MGEKNNLVLVVGAIVAFVLQIALAPAVALFSAQPNFLLAYALVVAIVIPTEAGPVLPFAMGLLYDLTGTGPVGGMALLLVIACFLASRVFSLVDNDTLFMPLAIFTAARFWPSFAMACCSWHAGLPPTLWRRCSPAPFRARCTTAPWAWWSTSSWRGCSPAAPRTAVCARRNCDRGRACSQLS